MKSIQVPVGIAAHLSLQPGKTEMGHQQSKLPSKAGHIQELWV